MFNPHTLIAARLFDRDANRPIGRRFFARRIERALRLRERLFDGALLPPGPCRGRRAAGPRRRPVRFGSRRAVQCRRHGSGSAAGPRGAGELLAPEAIVLRNDSPARGLEGLAPETRVARGELRRPGEGSKRTALSSGRSDRRAEDRLVLRPARQSALCRRARPRCAGARPLLLYRRVCREAARARRRLRCSASTAPRRR